MATKPALTPAQRQARSRAKHAAKRRKIEAWVSVPSHALLKQRAKREGKTLGTLAVEILERASRGGGE